MKIYIILVYMANIVGVLGSGNFGIVYLLNDGTALKALKNFNSCEDAAIELAKQRKIHDNYRQLLSIDSNNKTFNLFKKYVKISQPIESYNNQIQIKDETYACYYTMSLLNGIKMGTFKMIMGEHSDRLIKNIDPKSIFYSDKTNVMIHLALNDDDESKFVGTYSSNVSDKDPLRGYFLTTNDKNNTLKHIYDYLKAKNMGYSLEIFEDDTFNFDNSLRKIKNLIGFIYGWLYFGVKILPIDIEISLGLNMENKDMYTIEINVLDFGLTVDIGGILEIYTTGKYVYDFQNILGNPTKMEQRVKNVISFGVYCLLDPSVNMDRGDDVSFFLEGWNQSKELNMTGGGGDIERKYRKYKSKYIKEKQLHDKYYGRKNCVYLELEKSAYFLNGI